MSSAHDKHSKSQTHVHCYPQLILFGKQQKVAQHRNDVTSGQEQVKKKRVILRRFTGALYSLANQEISFLVHIFKHKKFRGISNCVENHGLRLENHVNLATII